VSFEARLLEPTAGRQPTEEIVGVYAMPINSTIQNTGDRMQTLVDKFGVPFIISDLFAQNRKKIFDMQARTFNSPNEPNYRDASLRRTDFVREQIAQAGLDQYATLGMGDSLGVAAIQGMQYYGLEAGTHFDAILLRDGWNLGQSESKARGFARYISYTVKDELHKKRSGVHFDETAYGFSDEANATENETSLPQKLWNVADMMRNHKNVTVAFDLAQLAAETGFVMNVVCLQQGLSGTPAQQESFVEALTTQYYESRLLEEQYHPVTLKASIVEGWHSDLLDPTRGGRDVQTTIDLMNVG
jgi:hypothetical protein